MEFIKKYKKYLLVIAAVIVLIICGFLLFKPLSNKWDAFLLSRPQVKALKEEIKIHNQNEKNANDTADYYRALNLEYKKSIDSSKTVTVYIEKQTYEEVNNISTLSLDSNVKQFPLDMEEYLSNRR